MTIPLGLAGSRRKTSNRHRRRRAGIGGLFDERFARLPHSAATSSPPPSPIAHVVFIIQENRSFNNLFMGYPGATTATYGYATNGRKIRLHSVPLGSFGNRPIVDGLLFGVRRAWANPPEPTAGWTAGTTSARANNNAAYAYVLRPEIVPYWDIARSYVLADRMFASDLDGSFVAHQYAVAAYASRTVDYPLAVWGCEGGKTDTVPTLLAKRTYGPSVPACFDNPTIADEADAAGVSWRFYAGYPYGDGGPWSAYQADRKIFAGPDWSANVISPPAQFLTDVGNGELAQ